MAAQFEPVTGNGEVAKPCLQAGFSILITRFITKDICTLFMISRIPSQLRSAAAMLRIMMTMLRIGGCFEELERLIGNVQLRCLRSSARVVCACALKRAGWTWPMTTFAQHPPSVLFYTIGWPPKETKGAAVSTSSQPSMVPAASGYPTTNPKH